MIAAAERKALLFSRCCCTKRSAKRLILATWLDEGRKRIVMEVAAQGGDRAVADDLLVDKGVAAPAGAVAADQAQAVVGIPIAVA